MTAPLPSQMKTRAVKASVHLLKDFRYVVEEYSWVHGYAFAEDHRARDIDSQGKKRSDPSDRTGDVAVQRSKTFARSRLERVAELMAELDAHIGAELKSMHALLREAIPEHDTGPAGIYPRTVTREDLAMGEAARLRRRGRGEGFGDG